jgi:hypothetical protein
LAHALLCQPWPPSRSISECRALARRIAREPREAEMDLMFLALIAVFFALSLGFVALCDRL